MHLFFSNPNRSFYVREITRKIDEQINSVRRELANLLSIGIISSDTTNNRLYYEVNQKYEFYHPLAAMFGKDVSTNVKKTTMDDDKEHEIKNLGNVEVALLTGQFTRDESSGIDLLVVGDINQARLANYVSALENNEGKELRYTAMSSDEFRYRRQINDRFLSTVLSSKKQVLIDKHRTLEQEKGSSKQARKEDK